MEKLVIPNRKDPILGIVVPCYNEQETLYQTIDTLIALLETYIKDGLVNKRSFLFLVDDGSTDKTFDIIQEMHSKNPSIKGLKFIKNFGSQPAILAGLDASYDLGADCIISIDADLQQDIRTIPEFVEKFKSGADIVFGIRKEQNGTKFFKKLTAHIFYKTMTMLGARVLENHSEYRLTSSRAINILSNYGEYNLFLRGMFNNIGLKKDFVHYKVMKRERGESKFNWASLMTLALDGITSYTVLPLRMVSVLGIVISFVSFFMIANVLYEKFFTSNTVAGWSTIVVCVCLFSGIQIFCLGIIGEYLGRIYGEVKRRPRYVKEIELK